MPMTEQEAQANDEKMRQYRKNRFAVRVLEQQEDMKDFPSEKRVEITYNGRQWMPWALSKEEAEKVVKAIQEAYGL